MGLAGTGPGLFNSRLSIYLRRGTTGSLPVVPGDCGGGGQFHAPYHHTSITAVVAMFFALVFLSFTSAKAVRLVNNEHAILNFAPQAVHRIFLGNGKNSLRTVDFIRQGVIKHRYGEEHLKRTISYIPSVQYGTPFAHELYKLINPRGHNTSLYTASYLCVLYLDFGIPGVMFGYLVMGLILGLSYAYLFERPKQVLNLVGISFSIFILGRMAHTGPIGMIPSAIILYLVYIIFKGGCYFHLALHGKKPDKVKELPA